MVDQEQVIAVLHDKQWTQRVVIAAARALNVLNGPDITADGDKASMVARNALSTGFEDTTALHAALEELNSWGKE